MAPSIVTTARGVAMVATELGRAGLDRVLPGGDAVPSSSSGVTPAWLADALGLPAGSIRSVRVVDEHSGTAARARIAVDAAPGTEVPDHLFVKFNPSSFSQQLMMNLFDLGRREVLAYQTLGDEPPVRVPRCYVARLDERRGRSLMVFEDLSGTATFRTVVDSVSPTEAEAVVDAMADQHIAFWRSPALARMTGRSQAANLLGDVIRRRFVGGMKGHTAHLVSTEMKHDARILFERSAGIDAMWAGQPQTLLHGDPHLGNLFFEGTRPGFLDWQVATSGCGIRDVAYFSTVSVEPDVLRPIERGLVERYAAKLDGAGIAVDLDHLWNLYRAGATEMFLSAIAAAEAGERAQPLDITYSGMLRSVAACEANDSFGALRVLVEGTRA
jgi:aminoglycoside phosphotransferase (APT) family kinase protein